MYRDQANYLDSLVRVDHASLRPLSAALWPITKVNDAKHRRVNGSAVAGLVRSILHRAKTESTEQEMYEVANTPCGKASVALGVGEVWNRRRGEQAGQADHRTLMLRWIRSH